MNQNEKIQIDVILNDQNVLNALGNILDRLDDLVTEAGNVTNALGNIDGALNETSGFLQRSTENFDFFGASIGLIVPAIGSKIEALGGLKGTLTTVGGAVTGFGAKLAGAGGLGSKLLGLATGPVGWLVGGLVAAGGLLFSFRNTGDAADNLGDGLDDLGDGLDELRGKLASNRTAHESNVRSIRTQATVMEELVDTIKELNGAGHLGYRQQTQLRIAMAALNSSTSDFELTLDSATGALEDNSDEILENMRAYHRVNAAIDESYAKVNEIISLHQDKAYAQKAVDELEESYADLETRIAGYREEMDATNIAASELTLINEENLETYNELMASYDELTTSLEVAEGQLAEMGTALEGYGLTIDDANERIAGLERQITESTEIMAQAVYDGTWRQIVSWDQLTEAQQSSINDLVDTYEWLREGSVNALTKMGTDAAVGMDEMLSILDHNYHATNAWGENLASIYDAVGEDATEGFMAWIEDMAKDNPAQLEEIANASDAELQQLVAAYTRNAGQIEDTLATAVGDEFDQVKDLFDRFGPDAQSSLRESVAAADFANPGGMMSKDVARGILDARNEIDNATNAVRDNLITSSGNIITGFASGISGGLPQVSKASSGFANRFIDTFRDELQENSPSRVFRTSGQNVIAGLVLGLKALQSQPTTRLQTIAQNMQHIYNTANRDYTAIGRDIMNGLNQGLLNGEGIVKATANRIANNIARTMRDALDINSPSRVMREQIGRQIPAGVAAGIDKYADYAIDSMHDLGNELTKINFPNINDIINTVPSLSLSGATIGGGTNNGYSVVNNNQGLFDGATINWSGEEDIRRTMEKIAWVTQRESSRMW